MPSTAVLDTFNRADAATLGGSWGTEVHTGWTSHSVATNQASNAAVAFRSNYWLSSFAADQEAYYTIRTAGTPRLYVRLATPGATPNAYTLEADTAAGQIYIGSIIGAQIGATIFQALAIGDSLCLEVTGSTLKAYHRPSGGSWTQVGGNRTDTTITAGGFVGFGSPAAASTIIDDFGGGAIGGATSDPALNTNVIRALGVITRCRLEIQEAGGAAVATAYKLRFSKNGGAYTDVGAATDCRYALSAMFAQGDPTTNVMTGGTGTFVAGQGSENAATTSITIGASGHTELEFAVTLAAPTVPGDTFDLRVYRSDGTALNSYAFTPRITAS